MSEDFNDVLNISAPVTLFGRRYSGVCVHAGVGVEFVNTCNPDSKALKFSNCNADIAERVQPMGSAISNGEVGRWNEGCEDFLHIRPLVPFVPPTE